MLLATYVLRDVVRAETTELVKIGVELVFCVLMMVDVCVEYHVELTNGLVVWEVELFATDVLLAADVLRDIVMAETTALAKIDIELVLCLLMIVDVCVEYHIELAKELEL